MFTQTMRIHYNVYPHGSKKENCAKLRNVLILGSSKKIHSKNPVERLCQLAPQDRPLAHPAFGVPMDGNGIVRLIESPGGVVIGIQKLRRQNFCSCNGLPQAVQLQAKRK